MKLRIHEELKLKNSTDSRLIKRRANPQNIQPQNRYEKDYISNSTERKVTTCREIETKKLPIDIAT